MAMSLRLFLIRHGETVDNVAQLLAGSRDSELTNHGVQQAIRLGQHFKTRGLTFTHIFSSHLRRAAETASKIRDAQLTSESHADDSHEVPQVTQLPMLMEQDFGSMEGKRWTDRPADSSAPGEHAMDFVETETKQAMGIRADGFLDEHLIPLLDESVMLNDLVVAIVSHGIFLSILWKRILKRLPPKSVTLCVDAAATPRPSLEHLGGWSNTGYLELLLTRSLTKGASPSEAVSTNNSHFVSLSHVKSSFFDEVKSEDKSPTIKPDMVRDWTTRVMMINGKDHLKGLKRTGGGVGSSRHDTAQRSIESFFKRRRLE